MPSTFQASSPFFTPKQMMYDDLETPVSHPTLFGYGFWLLGFFGAHRFYFGKPISGAIWFFTLGFLGVGWIVDLFLVPAMADEAKRRYPVGQTDYTITWLLLTFLGIFGVHRLYMGKLVTGIIYLLTGGLLGIGVIYDVCTLNEQIAEINHGSYDANRTALGI